MTAPPSSPDQRALEAIRSPNYDPSDTLTQPAVNAFLAPYLDNDPATGMPLVTKPYAVNDTGLFVFRTSAARIMRSTDNPAELSDRDVLTLVLTSACSCTYNADEWALMAQLEAERSAAYRAALKDKARKRHDTTGRQERAREQYRLERPPAGYRNATGLKHRQKMQITAALKAAEERRERRRKTSGIVIMPGRRAFEAMTIKEKQELRKTQTDVVLDNATALQTLGDLMDGPDVEYAGFLYRFGRANR